MKLIHFEVPKNEYGVPTISIQEMGNIVEATRKILESYEDIKVIASPFKVTWSNGIAEIYNVNDLNINQEVKSKFLEFIDAKFKEYELTYVILDC